MRSPIPSYLDDVLASVASDKTGELANYIPELAGVNPDRLGASIAMVDGELYGAGDVISPLQSWVDVVADIIERGKAQQIFHTELSSQDAAAILVGSFDGLKTSNDALAQGDTEKFRRQAHALNTMLIEGLQRR